MSQNEKPTTPGAHICVNGVWVTLPESTPLDTAKWERKYGIPQAEALGTGRPPLMEHLMYSFYLLYVKATKSDIDFDTFLESISDLETIDEPEDPQAGEAESEG